MGFTAAFVPHGIEIHAAGIVIRFGVVATVISHFPEKPGIIPDRFRFGIPAPHLLVSTGAGVHPGDDRVPGRGTHRGVCIGPGIPESFGGQPVEVGGGGKGIPVASQEKAIVLTGNPEDVRKFIRDFVTGKLEKEQDQYCRGGQRQFHGIIIFYCTGRQKPIEKYNLFSAPYNPEPVFLSLEIK
jgi:hypothetical protein